MQWKKLMTIAFAGSLCFMQIATFGSNPVKAANQASEVVTTDIALDVNSKEQKSTDSKEQMNQIVLKVKNAFQITDEFKNFEFSYDEYEENPMWYFTWMRDDETRIHVCCDKKGHITYYNQSSNDSSYQTPSYLQSELKEKADAYLKQVAADEASHVQYKECKYKGIYFNSYMYTYVRVENDVLVPDNTITLTLNAKTGELVRYSANWDYESKFSSKIPSKSKSEAKSILANRLQLLAEYQISRKNNNSGMTGELVYKPSDEYLAVDAYSGKIFDSRIGNINTSTEESADETANKRSDGNAGATSLTEEEIKKLEELDGLLTKEEAIKAMKNQKSLWIDSKASKISANLYKDTLDESNQENQSYIWNLSLYDPSEDNYNSKVYYQANVNARVDAKTGEVVSFYANTPYYVDGDAVYELKYNEADGKKIAEEYLGAYYKEQYKKTQYDGVQEGYIIQTKEDSTIYGGKIYTFTRVQKGVPVPSNQFVIGVDLKTGKIYQFQYAWFHQVVFESKTGMITEEQAYDAYLNLDGFQLIYEINTQMKGEKEETASRLVYSTEGIIPEYIDAFTGKQVDYSGEEIKTDYKISYDDIRYSKYKRAIQLLADMGIGFNQSQFKPDAAITRDDLKYLWNGIGYFSDSSSDLKGNEAITREIAAYYVVKALGLDTIAKKDMFKDDFADSKEINPMYYGYVVLAKNLDLMQCDDSNAFRPKAKLTRGEAAQLLIQMCNNYSNK